MYTAAELIHALQRRLRLTVYRNRPGEFPPGWQAWFDQMPKRAGAVTGASVESILAVLLQRPLAAPPPRTLALNQWQAFSTLWRQEWQPPPREEFWVRALAATVSGLVHVVFAVLLMWLGIVHYLMMSSTIPRGEEAVIQVEYIGTGAPEEVGGGPVAQAEPVEPAPAQPRPGSQPQEQPPADAAVAAPARPELPPLPELPHLEPPRLQMPQPQVVQREIPAPEPPAEQPLAVSKPVPDRSSFVLPPPTMEVPDTEVAVSPLQLPALEVRVAPAPEPLPEFQPSLPQVEVERPSLDSEIPEVVVREIPVPLPRPELPQLPDATAPAVPTPELQAQIPQVRERSIPLPTPATPTPVAPAAPAAAADTAVAEAQDEAVAPEPAAPAPDATPAEAPVEPVVGAGPEPIPAPGGWPAPKVDDSWDLADSEQPGGEAGEPPGLYDSDGSVNMAETPGSASPGLPPGTVTQEIANLDRAGTWLRRPPIGYEASPFAKYWRPNESLLAEWVRKSITTISIPIPGTSKSIVCKTVLVAVGGSCWVQDPNLNNQPATARPPPDIPFKPELQEGNSSAPL